MQKVFVLVFLFSIQSLAVKNDCGRKLGEISLSSIKERLDQPTNPLQERVRTAVQLNGFRKVAYNMDIIKNHNADYTNQLDVATVTDQKQSGRCWIFGACNPLRHSLVARKMVPPSFQFSENYLHFFNMLEKSNKYLVEVINSVTKKSPNLSKEDTRKKLSPSTYIVDGGWHEYFEFLVEKYGLVPKSVMPETISSEATMVLLDELRLQTSVYAQKILDKEKEIRSVRNKFTEEDLLEMDKIRLQAMDDIIEILRTHLGSPVTKFTYRKNEKAAEKNPTGKIRDSGKVLGADLIEYTPQSFAKDFVGFNAEDYVPVANFESLQQNKVYEIKNSAIGAGDGHHNIKMLTLSSERMLELVKTSIDNKIAPWFGAAMGRDVDNSTGIMKVGIFPRKETYGFAEDISNTLSRSQQTMLNVLIFSHAMAFTAYDQPNKNSPIIKLKVDNSWSDKVGDKGVYHMYLDWFTQNVFQVVIHKSFLTPEELKIWEGPVQKIKDEELF